VGLLEQQFGPIYEAIGKDIFKFCAAMNFTPTWQQAEVLSLVQQGHKRVACKSGKGPGKTSVSVIVGLWSCFRRRNALTMVTAPTMRQAKEVWLAECRRLVERADPAIKKWIEVTNSRVIIGESRDWGVKLITATKEENAQGIHEDNLFFIVEEASGVERPIMNAIETTVTNKNGRVLAIGNPNTRDCAFFDYFARFRHRWATITLNTEDSARIKVMRNGELEPMVSPELLDYLIEKFGRDSDVYRISVLGEFPLSDPNCVISAEQAEIGMRSNLLAMARLNQKHTGAPARQFGIDFARFGADESVVYRRAGNAIVEWQPFSRREPAHVVDYAFRLQEDAHWKNTECIYVADAGGMGQGVMHKFHDAGKRIIEFHNQGVAAQSQRFDNKITEAWFNIAELFKKGQIHIPNDNRLIQQLTTRQYHTTKKGKLVLESKDDFKKRSKDEDGASPDRADALVMAFYDEIVAPGFFSAA
jgi:phage terminase large subunit